tara:strand:- start:462 stop:1109 length:648 start_codon:yes stop_codon:yes gene_type:complete
MGDIVLGSPGKTVLTESGGTVNWGTGIPSGSVVQVQFHQFGGLGDDESGDMSSLSTNTNYVLQTSGNTSGGGQTGVVDTNITPRITGSKMWIQSQWFGEINPDQSQNIIFFFWRSVGSTHTKLHGGYTNASGSPDEGLKGIMSPGRTYWESHVGSTPEHMKMQYFDTHGVSAGTTITYKLGFVIYHLATQIFTNRCQDNAAEVGVTNLCVTELAP